MNTRLKLQVPLIKRDLSFAAVFAESVLDAVPVFNVITSHVEPVIMFDVPFAKA